MRELCEKNPTANSLRVRQIFMIGAGNMANEILTIEDCPEEMNLEQFRKIAHISKRNAAFLLQNKIVPCKTNNKRTHCYTVKKSDVFFYLADRETNPDKYSVSLRSADKTYETVVKDIPEGKILRPFYSAILSNYPDLLTTQHVVALTGYSKTVVDKWLSDEKLPHLECICGNRIPKTWFVDFLCSAYFNGIKRKSNLHRSYLSKALKKK